MRDLSTILAQKARHLYDELDKKKPQSGDQRYMVSEKLDGWYGYINSYSDSSKRDNNIYSRAGRAIPAMADFGEILEQRMQNTRTYGRLIFEIYTPGVPFSIQNGIYNRKFQQDPACEFHVHDFLKESTDDTAVTRRAESFHIVNRLELSRVKYIPLIGILTTGSLKPAAESVWRTGGEGVIGVSEFSTYEAGKRTHNMLKVKEEVTLDLLVVGLYGGDGKYENTLGGIIVKDSNQRRHRVSGMTDEQRDTWYNNPMSILGSVVEVKAMKILPDGQLREPRFKAIRYDKTREEID